MKVAAVAVADGEAGTITVSIKDETGATSTITLSHPLVNGQSTTSDMTLTLMPGKEYPFTVSHTGVAQHYKLGSTDKDLWIGQEHLLYLESPVQDWRIQATSSETVTLEFTKDNPDNGANQANTIKVSVYDLATSALVHQASTTLADNTPWTVTVAATSTAKSYLVKIEPDGHFHMQKTSGPDRHFYVLPCPEQPEHEDPPTGGGGDVGDVRGIKFEDKNNNGKMDSGEPGLSGWTIYHDANNNHMLDSGESSTTTDSAGNYELKGLPKGLQYIREVQKSGWKQTAPSQYGAALTGAGQVPPSTSTATGWASIDYNASTSDLWFEVTWAGIQGGTTTNLHIHQGATSTNGSIVVDLIAASGASSTAFTEPVADTVTVSTTTASDLAAGNLYVNLHTEGFPSGEIRGQIMDTGRALVENVPGGGVVTGRNFGNISTGTSTPPTGGEPGDECSCIIGIFESDQTHDWELIWVGATSSAQVSTVLKVAAVSVNSSETGTIVVTIKDEGASTTTITVVHPTTQGAETKVEEMLTLIPGKRYPFTVAYTGSAHHYKLGSKDKDLAMGQEEISYLEAEEQSWMINVDAGEVVKLTFNTDSASASNGANQTNQYKLTIKNASGTVIFSGATTTISAGVPQTVTVGTSTSQSMWTVQLSALDGHIRMTKDSGSDHFFYVLPCPDHDGTPQDTGGTPTPIPGVGTWGLVVMTGLLGAAFVWTVRRRRRSAVQD
jgi:hypothetical protein